MPESEPGWVRMIYGGQAVRTIETDPNDPNNHFFVINSLANNQIADFAVYHRQIDPNGPNERWWAEWRLKIAGNAGETDQGMGFASDNQNKVGFDYGFDYIYNGYDGWSMAIAPGVFHTYRLESASMTYYTLWIDGQIVRQAPFFEGLGSSYGGFGDETQGGGRSIGKWDYFRFGVCEVPEPAPLGLIMIWCVCGAWRRR